MTNSTPHDSGTQDVPSQLPRVIIYTDGSCEPNPGIGGWGAILVHPASGKRREHSGYIGNTTNNIAELRAAIEALKLLKTPCMVDLHSDSQWLVNCATGQFKRHKYHDMWLELDRLTETHRVNFRWVRGHSNNPDNARAHQLANRGRMLKGGAE